MHRSFQQRYGADLLEEYDVEEEISRFDTWRKQLADFVIDQTSLIVSARVQPTDPRGGRERSSTIVLLVSNN